MKSIFRIFALLLAFALIGAPVGMARMMGGHEVSTHQHHHGQTPQKSAPHIQFMVCAACAAVTAPPAALPERMLVAEAVLTGELSEPDGVSGIPLLPPPRS
jgi:hypothetical protein